MQNSAGYVTEQGQGRGTEEKITEEEKANSKDAERAGVAVTS
jgi:hypothetical protein